MHISHTIRLLIGLQFLFLLASCAEMRPIQRAETSLSGFSDSVYSGETVSVNLPTPGVESYRVFNQGASGFVPQTAVRDSAERRAIAFCKNEGKEIRILEETKSSSWFLRPGNFPKAEIVFECIEKHSAYGSLVELKRLLDIGAITQKEFDTEKSKILGK